MGNLLFEIDIFFADPSDLCGVLDAGVGQTEGKVDLGLFHGGEDFLALGGVGAGFEIFLIEVDRADGVAQFIAVKEADLQIGLGNIGIHRQGFLELFDGSGIVEIRNVLGGLTKEGISFIFGVRTGRGLGAGREKDAGKKDREKRDWSHRVMLIGQKEFRKPRVCLGDGEGVAYDI